MKTLETPWEKKLHIWALAGPLCIFFTIAFSFLKPTSNPYYLPYAGLFGLTISWRWPVSGLALIIGVLIALVVSRFPVISREEWIWESGISLALSLGCLATSFSFQEDKKEKEKPSHWHEFKRAEGMYEQLRIQFEEKSAELDRTRKELFQIQEKLEQLTRDQEERYIYERSSYEESMERYVNDLEKKYRSTIEELKAEIEQLEGIITTLSKT